jgi:predicted N-acyltransferase
MEKENSPLNITITADIADIPKEKWDELFGPDTIESYGYHKALQESELKEFSIYYLLAKHNNALVAIIPFFVMDFSFTTLIRGPLQGLIIFFRKFFPRFLKMKLLFLGAPTTEYLYLGISQSQNLKKVLDRALIELKKLCKEQSIEAIIAYNLTPQHKELTQYFEKEGFSRMENFPNARIEIAAASVEDYINTLGKSTRKDIRRKLRKASSMAKLNTDIYENIESVKEETYKLYMNNFNESDIHFEILTPQFFTNLCRNMQGNIKCFITRDGEKIVAFNLCMVKGDFCIDKFLGLDYNVAHKYSLYYTTFFHNIDWCIKNGIRFYQPGQGDYDAKIRLGATLIPLYIYIKTSNPLLKISLKGIIKLSEPRNFDPALRNLEKYRKAKKEIFADYKFMAGSKIK